MTDQKHTKEPQEAIKEWVIENSSLDAYNALQDWYSAQTDIKTCANIEEVWVGAWNAISPQLDELTKQRDELRDMLQRFVVLDDGDERFAWKHEVLFNEARDILTKTKVVG